MKEVQVIKTMTDANKLLDLGHLMKKVDRDRDNRDFLIFIFWNSEKLQSDLKNISKWIKNNVIRKDWLDYGKAKERKIYSK